MPLWVISGHLNRSTPCPLYPKSGRVQCTSTCPLWANSGHQLRQKETDSRSRTLQLPAVFGGGRPLGVNHEIARDRHRITLGRKQQLKHHV